MECYPTRNLSICIPREPQALPDLLKALRVAQGVAGGVFRDLRQPRSIVEGPLDTSFVQVMATPGSRSGICGKSRGRKDVLPAPLGGSARVFSCQGVRKIDLSVASRQILVVKPFDRLQVAPEVCFQGGGQHGHTVFRAFAIPGLGVSRGFRYLVREALDFVRGAHNFDSEFLRFWAKSRDSGAVSTGSGCGIQWIGGGSIHFGFGSEWIWG